MRFIITAAIVVLIGAAVSAATIGYDGPNVALEDLAAEWGSDRVDNPSHNKDGMLSLQVPKADALLIPAPEAPPAPTGGIRAHAYQFVSRIFHRPATKPTAVGFVRRGVVLQAGHQVNGPGCDHGAWYTLRGGYVCSRDGFAISSKPHPISPKAPLPDVGSALPYRYGKARTTDVLRYYSKPTSTDKAAIDNALAEDHRMPDVVERRLDGVYLLALDRMEQQDEKAFYRTVRGRYVRVEDVELKPTPTMHGELLSGAHGKAALPIAFVYGDEDATLFRRHAAKVDPVGRASKHARFSVDREARWGDVDMVLRADGVALPRERARLARRIQRPDDVGSDDKWIHINLDEQTLVAYEGDKPVFATLVSSGKGAEFATPTGLFQVREKHISVTMNGPDPDAGYYEVEEVPWTQYYFDSYALHGAYWHNDFGKTRSHGCTNISPIDARWLFYWTEHQVPSGWHALRKLRGTFVFFTRDKDPQ